MKSREREMNLLNNEIISLKEKLQNLEKHSKNVIEDNKSYRIQIENTVIIS